jgi:signal transduction histidine kinase
MTADFMDDAQVEAGRFELKPELVDGRTLVLRSVDLFVGTSPKHVFDVDVPGDDVPVVCDAHRVEQVLVNLISNAIKYSPQGGTVRVEARAMGSEAVFAVSDQGIGLSEDEIGTIFEPFRRSGRLQLDVPGTGLGLSIVRRIVEAHEGRIEVESEPGRGSTFRFRLALASATSLAPKQQAAEVTPAR